MLIQIDGITVEINRKRIKNVYLRVTKLGEVSVSAPPSYPVSEIEKLVTAKRSWILKQQKNALSKQAITLCENAEIELLGRKFMLVRVDKKRGESAPCYIDGEKIVIPSSQKSFTATTERFLSQILLTNAQNCLRRYSSLSGLTYGEVAVKKMSSQWGYCRLSDKKIVFSLALIFKPYECLKYVAIHELAHTVNPAHDKKFYALIEKYEPNYKQARMLLKK